MRATGTTTISTKRASGTSTPPNDAARGPQETQRRSQEAPTLRTRGYQRAPQISLSSAPLPAPPFSFFSSLSSSSLPKPFLSAMGTKATAMFTIGKRSCHEVHSQYQSTFYDPRPVLLCDQATLLVPGPLLCDEATLWVPRPLGSPPISLDSARTIRPSDRVLLRTGCARLFSAGCGRRRRPPFGAMRWGRPLPLFFLSVFATGPRGRNPYFWRTSFSCQSLLQHSS